MLRAMNMQIVERSYCECSARGLEHLYVSPGEVRDHYRTEGERACKSCHCCAVHVGR